MERNYLGPVPEKVMSSRESLSENTRLATKLMAFLFSQNKEERKLWWGGLSEGQGTSL